LAAGANVELGHRRGERFGRKPSLEQLGFGPDLVDRVRRRIDQASEHEFAVGGHF
jgi:hypothetical protein